MLEQTNDRTKFFVFGVVTSVALHALCGFSLIVRNWDSAPDKAPELLIIELQGIVADTQVKQQTMETIKGDTGKESKEDKSLEKTEQPQDVPEKPPQEAEVTKKAEDQSSTSSKTSSEVGDGSNVSAPGAKTEQIAQTVRAADEKTLLRDYARKLGPKIEASLRENQRGKVDIAFTIQADGSLRPGSLKIVHSSGQTALDASALDAVRAIAPFEPPPREMTITITVNFDRKR